MEAHTQDRPPLTRTNPEAGACAAEDWWRQPTTWLEPMKQIALRQRRTRDGAGRPCHHLEFWPANRPNQEDWAPWADGRTKLNLNWLLRRRTALFGRHQAADSLAEAPTLRCWRFHQRKA